MGDLKSELEKIREKRGKLTPRIVAEEAKSKTHPLHDKVYDVPQKEAADRYYLGNARRLLQVTFRQTHEDGHTSDLRHYLVVKGTEEHPESTYEPIEKVAQDDFLRKLTLSQMQREFLRFKARYGDYAEFFEMLRADPDIFPVDPDEEYGDGDGTNG